MPRARVSGSRNRLTLQTVFVTDSPYARRALIHHRLICAVVVAVAVAVGGGVGTGNTLHRQMEAIVNNFHFIFLFFCFSILLFAFYLRLRHIPSYTLSFVCSRHRSHPPLSLSFALSNKNKSKCHHSLGFASPRLARALWRERVSDWFPTAMGVDTLQTGSRVCVCVSVIVLLCFSVVKVSFARLDQVAVSPSELSLICVFRRLFSALSHDCRCLTVIRKWSSALLYDLP